jgi:hypothetical protein
MIAIRDLKKITGAKPTFFIKGLRKSKKNLIQDSQYSGLNSNRAPPEYKSEALPTEPPCTSPHFLN